MQVCEAYEARISALIDDELTAGERVEVLEHIARCPACKAYWEDQLLIRDALREPEQTAPAGFADAVMARVRETAQDAAPEKKTVRFPGWKRFAGLAACCAVVLLGVWAMELAPELARGGANDCAVSNSAAPQMYARDDASLNGNAVETPEAGNGDYGTDGAAACDAPPESAAEKDDAKAYSGDSDCAAVLTTDSAVAESWVEDILGADWVNGECYELSEEQYRELRKLLEEAGEKFNEIMGENDSGSYQLLAE